LHPYHIYAFFFYITNPRPHRLTLFPYTTLFRSIGQGMMIPALQRLQFLPKMNASVRKGITITLAKLGERSVIPKLLQMLAQLSKDRKSTRLNSSHLGISYAVFCLKKKKKNKNNY